MKRKRKKLFQIQTPIICPNIIQGQIVHNNDFEITFYLYVGAYFNIVPFMNIWY